MKMRESDRLKKLHYSALESKLYQALRETIKPGTPEASLLSTLEMKASMERRMPTSMQLLYALVDRIRVPEEDESAVYTGALLNATVQTVPGKSEEQSIEDFLTRWDNALNNLRYSETMINPKVLARTFLSKIKGAACMTYTAEKWEEIPQEQRTYDWIRGKVDMKLRLWRQEHNREEMQEQQQLATNTGGYAAMPAPNRDQSRGRTSTPYRQGSGGYGARRDSRDQGEQRGKSNSSEREGDRGRGVSVPPGVRALIGTKDDPKVRFGSRSPHGKRRICYPFTRGECPKTALDCQYSHDIYLYDDAQPFLEQKGYCPAFPGTGHAGMRRASSCARSHHRKCSMISPRKKFPRTRSGQKAHTPRRRERILSRGEPRP